MAAFLLMGTAKASQSFEVPPWVLAEIDEHAPILAGLLDLPREPFGDISYDPYSGVPGLLAVDGTADAERITMHLSGDWSEPDEAKRLLLLRNLAHELAHVRQHSFGMPQENRFFHEGFAEGMGIEAIRACAELCQDRHRALLRSVEQSCALALRDGPLLTTESWESVYGCGGVFFFRAGEASGKGAKGLYQDFAALGERSPEAFLGLLEEKAGKAYALRAARFLNDDHRLARPRYVLRRLRAGRP
jgi:hypothetical protein